MTLYATSLAAMAALCAWLAAHHGWLALRRPDLAVHRAYAALAAGIAVLSSGSWLVQAGGGSVPLAFADGVTSLGVFASLAALVWFVRVATATGPGWMPRLLGALVGALALLWLAKPHGLMSAPITAVLAEAAPWGERILHPDYPYDWSYNLALAVVALVHLWCVGAALVAWRRSRAGRHLALLVSLLLICAAVAMTVVADLLRLVLPALTTHCTVALAVIMSHALSQEMVRAIELERRLRLAERFEALGRLAAGVAHDFGNILTAVGGAAELLRLRLGADPESRELLEMIASASERGSAINRRILAHASGAKIRSGRLDLHAAIREIAALVARRDLRIDLRLEAVHHHVEGDPAQLTSLLLNLATNAREAMPGGGSLLFATANRPPASGLALRHGPAPGDPIEVVVADSGSGIPAAVLERMWEPLFTTKAHGTGLGMVQVDEALRGLGGAVALASTPGGGTEFRIWLPRRRGSSSRRAVAGPLPVLVACRLRTEAELRAAALAALLRTPVWAVDPDDSNILPGVAIVAEAEVAAGCAALHPGVPVVVLGAGGLPADAAPEAIAAELRRLTAGTPVPVR